MKTNPLFYLGLFAVGSQAQEVAASIRAYASSDCGSDLNGDDTRSIDFGVWKDAVIEKDSDDGECTRATYKLDSESNPWPRMDDDNGAYKIYVDKSTIGDGCKLMLFHLSRDEDVNSNACKSAYATIDSTGGCQEAQIGEKFGYG